MPVTAADLAALDARIAALLPPRYLHCLDAVKTKSMGSAGLRYDAAGRVLWDQVWTSFCDLALAGGPPHRGTLLTGEPPAAADRERYAAAAEEIARGVNLVTFLECDQAAAPGWVGVQCRGDGMAAWMVRAVVAENVLARRRGQTLEVPAGAHFRVEKELKNVVTAVAKACHYWDDHPPAELAGADPAAPGAGAGRLAALVGGVATEAGWVGVSCPDEDAAVWLLRAVAVSDVLVRREGTTLWLAGGADAAEAERVAAVLGGARELHAAAGRLGV